MISLVCYWGKSNCQSYGLGFLGHEYVADKRSGLNLFPNNSLHVNNNFELSFEVSFLPGKEDYFGYLFRIIENDKRNIDLIYRKNLTNSDPKNQHEFKLVIGEQFTKVNFSILYDQLVGHWNKLTVSFDFDHDILQLKVNNKKFIIKHAGLTKPSDYKVFFGANNYRNFQTVDNLSIQVRNIEINIAGGKKYFWPLNELTGSIAYESNYKSNAEVTNPLWMRTKHRNWSFEQNIKIKGITNIAFDKNNNVLYIIGEDSLLKYPIKDHKLSAITYRSGRLNLPLGSQSAYNCYTNILYNFSVDKKHKTVASFNFLTKRWNKNHTSTPSLDYLQFNNFFSPSDSSLYVIGGYGHYTYKNDIQRYNLLTSKWEKMPIKGDSFKPRYLSALGTVDSGKTAYIIGGYGSNSGDQRLNSQNFYDLLKFDVKSKSLKKIYDLNKTENKDFTWANSMVISPDKKTFGALVFTNGSYSSNLQFLLGSLQSPNYQLVGNRIPYYFLGSRSFASLYYSSATNQYIAVTLFISDDNYSTIKVYSLSTPLDLKTLGDSNKFLPADMKIIAITIAILLIVIAYSIYALKKRKLKKTERLAISLNSTLSESQVINTRGTDSYIDANKGAILLFGDLELRTATGVDITKNFTPLIKELFLTIFIKTVTSDRGVNPDKLLELLWFDKSESSARNNRAANISRLKTLLNQMDHVTISANTGNWKIDVDYNELYVDYHHYLQIIASRKDLSKQNIIALLNITKRGSFVTNAEYPWLDHIKAKISSEVIDIYLSYAQINYPEEDPEFLIELTNGIFHFDPVNEEAMIIKCQTLSRMGKHFLAKSTFDIFKKEYYELYGEAFKKTFKKVLEDVVK